MRHYSPSAAWRRAAVYSLCCWGVACLAGTTSRVFRDPVATAGQLADPAWWAFLGAAVATIVVAYGFVWSRNTLVFDRPRRWGVQIGFGLMWGSGSGMWLATLYVLAERTGWPRWGVWLLAFALISLWQALWQDMYWDVYVAPEHDTPASIRMKVPTTHIPNILVTLTFLVVHDNVAIFAALQALALTIASVAMRMPAWWETRPVLAANTEPGLFGLPRCKGYEGPLAPSAGAGLSAEVT